MKPGSDLRCQLGLPGSHRRATNQDGFAGILHKVSGPARGKFADAEQSGEGKPCAVSRLTTPVRVATALRPCLSCYLLLTEPSHQSLTYQQLLFPQQREPAGDPATEQDQRIVLKIIPHSLSSNNGDWLQHRRSLTFRRNECKSPLFFSRLTYSNFSLFFFRRRCGDSLFCHGTSSWTPHAIPRCIVP